MASLTRQPTLSNDIIFNKVNLSHLMNTLGNCSVFKLGKFKQGQRGDIYWNSDEKHKKNSLQHLSLHPGGSQNMTGAVHFRYIIPELNAKYNFPIKIVRNATFVQKPLKSYGRHIYVNLSEMAEMDYEISKYLSAHHASAEEQNNMIDKYAHCLDMIHEMGNCLDEYISQFSSYIVSTYKRSVAGRGKTKRKKTNKNKTRRG